MIKTPMPTKEAVSRNWHLIDLKDQTLGRVSTQIAILLMGKHKTNYTPHIDAGDYVVVINAALVKVTGTKTASKIYRHHTGYPGGFREATFSQVQAKDPRKIISFAVRGMLPKNRLRDDRMKRLKIFAAENHPYNRQFAPKDTK